MVSEAGAPSPRVPEQARDFYAASLGWLDKEAQPRVMVDSRLEILWQNDAGAKLLAARHELEAVKGILTTTKRVQQHMLAQFIGDARDDLTTLQIPRKDEQGFLLLRAVRLDSDIVGCVAVRTGTEYKPNFLDLDLAFNLTTSEHRVLIGLLDGRDADKLARLHGVSLDTTRTHIRNLYAKMGVNSRESMFARALPFRI
ncbi:MAG: hypothetical protein JNM03_02585 [Sphingopyxis sp.]|uniref:helix-turn-helix transcriptional regulator n=1 Tax=Sphingopyxis sp. TaxID=1908224 RepID=UPI001A5FC350|nr:LuxR C-terminal-related transcriptional regulator [Sphingopyxis sp.]MBL9068861.1 hypothetical protein [Sphingopyxis sp.]